MTRVLVDLLFFTGRRGGMESYVRHLYEALADSSVEFIALASHELAITGAPWFPGDVRDSGVSGESRGSWALGELRSVERAARTVGADVVHCPANVGPWSGSVPVALTLHDLLPFRHPEYVPGLHGPALRRLVRGAARYASRIVTSSRAAGSDIESVLGIDSDAIDIVPLGADIAPRTKYRPGGPRQTLLALGNRLPHKNFDMLLEALSLIPRAHRPRLVITGGTTPDPLEPAVARYGLSEDVELVSWAPSATIDALYATATAVIVPTLFEGFGLPVLEAMARGIPVLCSDIPVLREVADADAAYFDPRRAESIARTIERELADHMGLERLSRAGQVRSRQFSWSRTGALTLASLERAASA